MAADKKSSRKSPRMLFYTRSVVCGMCGVTERELAAWEAEDLITPARLLRRSDGFEPLYDAAALERIRLIRTLADDLEVNVPGIGIILHLLEQIDR